MDNIFTIDLKSDETIIEKALCSEKMPAPSAASIAFIKSFACGYRVQKMSDGTMCELFLN